MYKELLACRVRRGARLLDEIQPGWADDINLRVFDVMSCSKCILGQLYHDFWQGQSLLTEKGYSCHLHAFDTDMNWHNCGYMHCQEQAEILNDEWQSAIKERQNG